jgi:hypothetical protein
MVRTWGCLLLVLAGCGDDRASEADAAVAGTGGAAGSAGSGGAATGGTGGTSVCGDGVCDGDETCASCALDCGSMTWTILTVDQNGPRGSVGGQQTAIAVDSSGGAHISYIQYPPGRDDGVLRYAYRAPGAAGFVAQTVDDSGATATPSWRVEPGADSAIAVDGAGNVHIAYTYLVSQSSTLTTINLRHAYRPVGGSFAVTTIDDAGRTGSWPAAALDGSGALAVSYYDEDPDYDLKFAAEQPGGGFATQTIDRAGFVGAHSAIAIDASGGVHVSYTNPLEYIHRPQQGDWEAPVTIDATAEGNILDTAIAVDSQGGLHVLYAAVVTLSPTAYRLRYATKPPGSPWSFDTLPSAGDVSTVSLVIDRADGIHGIYLDESDFRLYYIHRTLGQPFSSAEVVDGMGGGDWAGLDNSLAVDRHLRLHAAYLHPTDQQIRYAYRCAP